jgi:hypothetical protein
MNYTDTSDQTFLPGQTAQQPDEIDVILVQLPKYEKEKIPNVKASFRTTGDLDLTKLVQNLKQMDYPLDMNMIFYYSPITDMYIYCGKEPLHHNTFVPAQDISMQDDRRELCLRIRHIEHTITQSIDPSLELETAALIDVEPDMDQDSSSTTNEKGKRKRHKERKIGEVLDLVLKWRKLYSGIRDPRTGQIVKLSLDDAAKRVGVAKKSLDDYLLQIRSAKKSGFNFQEHYNERVGVLRSYVKKTKSTKSSSTRHQEQDLDESTENMPSKSLRSKKIRKDYDDEVYGNE